MSILDREATVAPPGYNRWLVPPAALAIHLAIGQVYAFSVFKTAAHEAAMGVDQTSKPRADWTQSQIAVIFSIAIACSWACRRRCSANGWNAPARARR